MTHHRWLIVALFLVFAFATPISAPAQAQGVALECQGSSTTHYKPGLTFTAREVKITQDGEAGPCASTTNSEITSGTWHLEAEGLLSCTTGSADGLRTYLWNNGTSSVEAVTITVGARPAGETVLVTQGEIVEGEFVGAMTHSVAVLANPDATACASEEGVTSTSGPRQIVFTE